MSTPRLKKPVDDRIKIHARLTEDLDRRLRKAAFTFNLSKNEAIARAVELWVSYHEAEDGEDRPVKPSV